MYSTYEEFANALIPEILSEPDHSILKLGWVCRWVINLTEYTQVLFRNGDTILDSASSPENYKRRNLLENIWIEHLPSYPTWLRFINMEINQNAAIPIANLEYSIPIGGVIQDVTVPADSGYGDGEGGSSAPDENYDILHLVYLVNVIMGDEMPSGNTQLDFNNDEIIDIFDVIILIQLILESDE